MTGAEPMSRKLRLQRPDRTHLADFVAGLPQPASRLGLTHVTTGYLMREILDASKIWSPMDCPVLGEPLVYAFYGRAAFRSGRADVPSDLAFQFPAVLILDPDQTPAPKYVFGFDSGAFMDGRMDDYLDPHMPLFDFHLKPDVASAAALAAYFFETSEKFWKNQPNANLEAPPSNFELDSYMRMVRAGPSSNRLDDRVSTPELIFDQAIDLVPAVRAAVLPDVLSGDPQIGGRLAAAGILVREYEWQSLSRPAEYHMDIRKLIRGVYDALGWTG